MSNEQTRLNALKESMSPQQRQQMSSLIQNELSRRKSAASSEKSANGTRGRSASLNKDQVKELYLDVQGAMGELNRRQNQKTSGLKEVIARFKSRFSNFRMQVPAFELKGTKQRNILLLVCCLVAGKVLLGSGVVTASRPISGEIDVARIESASVALNPTSSHTVVETPRRSFGAEMFSESELMLLQQLDDRRVQLELREQELSEKEAEVLAKEEALNEQTESLRALREEIAVIRTQHQKRYSERLEQLAGVYSSMAPQGAAPLLEKLDDDTALALLERMPGKRMGQILSLMNSDRAIELTKSLSAPRRAL